MSYLSFPEATKVWIYQCTRKFTPEEEAQITKRLRNFFTTWLSGDRLVKSDVLIKHHQFIIIFADATEDAEFDGCVINESINCIKSIQKELDISLMDRMQVTFWEENKIKIVSINDFRKLLSGKEIAEETIVFNNVVTTKKAFEKEWEIPLKDSWHNQLLELPI